MADDEYAPDDEGWEPEVEEEETDRRFEALFVSRLTSRQRLLRGALAGGTVLLALVFLVGGFPTLGSQLAAIVSRPTPAPSATPPFNRDAYYLDTNLPDMTITLDGRTIQPNPPGATRPLRMPLGQHRVTWQAGPFAPQSCVFTVPASAGDTCPVVAATRSGPSFGSRPAHFVLLHEALPALAQRSQRALIAALQQSVSKLSTTVQPGELYYTQAQPNSAADQPLLATLRVRLNLQPATSAGALPACIFTQGTNSNASCAASITPSNCAALCILPFSDSASNFLALAPATLAWDYTTTEGQPVSLGQATSSGDSATTPHYMLFHVNWDGARWRATLVSGPALAEPILANGVQMATDPACIAAMDALYSSQTGQNADAVISYQSSGNPAEGCLSTISARDPQGTPLKFQFLSRFGILLPVDAAFQNLGPYVPHPSAAARRVAHDLAQYPAQTVNALPLGVFPL